LTLVLRSVIKPIKKLSSSVVGSQFLIAIGEGIGLASNTAISPQKAAGRLAGVEVTGMVGTFAEDEALRAAAGSPSAVRNGHTGQLWRLIRA